jgi:hypothetical protein
VETFQFPSRSDVTQFIKEMRHGSRHVLIVFFYSAESVIKRALKGAVSWDMASVSRDHNMASRLFLPRTYSLKFLVPFVCVSSALNTIQSPDPHSSFSSPTPCNSSRSPVTMPGTHVSSPLFFTVRKLTQPNFSNFFIDFCDFA